MKILVSEKISPHKYKTPEGYLVCVDSILSRTGKQEYRKNEVFVDSDDDSIVEVDRTEKEVFSPQALASFENKPITIEHPDEDVTTDNYKDLSVGFVRDIKKGEFEGEPVMLGTLVITDSDAIRMVEEGELEELSCGYDCDIQDEENPQQRNIRGNHVALCERGRAGIARIVDSVKDAEFHRYTISELKNFKPGTIITIQGKEYTKTDNTDIPWKDKYGNKYSSTYLANYKLTKDSEGEIEMKDNYKKYDKFKNKKGEVIRIVRVENDGEIGYVDEKNRMMNASPVWFEAMLKRKKFEKIKDNIHDEDVKDAKEYRIIVNGIQRVKWEANSAEEAVKEFLEANPAYANGKKGNVEARDCSLIADDEDLLTKAINDEVATIELYNTMLDGGLDDETREIIEEIRDDENDHLVKLTKIKNGTADKQDTVEDECVKDSIKDAKEYRIIVNGIQRVKWEANSAEEAVKEFMEANPAYANHKKGKVEARDCDLISDDEDLLTKDDKKLRNGYILKRIAYGKSGRKYAIIYRPSMDDYVVAAGYNESSQDWDQGYYDIKSFERAMYMVKKAQQIAGDSVKDSKKKLSKKDAVDLIRKISKAKGR